MDTNEARVELELPPSVEKCMARLGESARVIGGPVRDRLLGRPKVVDWDLATPLPPDEVKRRITEQNARADRFGTLSWSVGDLEITVASFRRDGVYGDHRHPDRVEFVTEAAIDACRRDFTVNALYADQSGRVFDYVGGLDDLHARRLRVIGDPVARLAEDPLRVLRGVRFGAVLGLAPDGATRSAMLEVASSVTDIAPPRRFSELDAGWAERPGEVLRQLQEFGLVGAFATALDEASVAQTAAALDQLGESDDRAVRWAVALHRCAHPVDALRALEAPRALTNAVARQFALLDALESNEARSQVGVEDLARIAAFCRLTRPELSSRCDRLFASNVIDGADVLALGVSPGPLVGQILDAAKRDIAAGTGRTEALARLAEIVSVHIKDNADPADRDLEE